MSVSADEIPQETQDRIRGEVPIWGQLSSSNQDLVLRLVHGAEHDRARRNALLLLLGGGEGIGGTQRLPDADPDERERMLVLTSIGADSPGFAGILEALHDVSPGAPVVRAALAAATRALLDFTVSADVRTVHTLVAVRESQTERHIALVGVLRHTGFMAMPVDQRTKLIEVVAHAGSNGLAFVTDLLDPDPARFAHSTVPPSTPPARSTDLQRGQTLVDALHELTSGELEARVEVPASVGRVIARDQARPGQTGAEVAATNRLDIDLPREHALGALIAEVARPDQHINQDSRGTCTMTTLSHRLAVNRPAEYARLCVSLLKTGRATLQSGDAIEPPSDAFANDQSWRSPSERLLQSALMNQWARFEGPNVRYHNVLPAAARVGDQRDSLDGFTGSSGDWRPPMQRVFERTLGAPLRLVPAGVPAFVGSHFAQHPGTPLFVEVRWSTGTHVFDLLDARPSTGGVAGEVRLWNPWGAAQLAYVGGMPVTLHSTSVDPPGDAAAARGATTQTGARGPARRTIDDSRAIQAIPWHSFVPIALSAWPAH